MYICTQTRLCLESGLITVVLVFCMSIQIYNIHSIETYIYIHVHTVYIISCVYIYILQVHIDHLSNESCRNFQISHGVFTPLGLQKSSMKKMLMIFFDPIKVENVKLCKILYSKWYKLLLLQQLRIVFIRQETKLSAIIQVGNLPPPKKKMVLYRLPALVCDFYTASFALYK